MTGKCDDLSDWTMQSIFQKYDKQSYSSCYECPPGMRGKKLKLPENPFNPYFYDYSDVLTKYAKYPTFGFPDPNSLKTTFKTERDMIQCVPCMAGRFNSKYGYPNSPEWDPDALEMIDGTDCKLPQDCDDVACHACGPGQMSSLYALTCTLCAPGRFQDESISSVCKFCVAGQFDQNYGSDGCKFDDLFFTHLSASVFIIIDFGFIYFDLLLFFNLIYRFNMSRGVDKCKK